MPKKELDLIFSSIVVLWTPVGINGTYVGESTNDPDDAVIEYLEDLKESCVLDVAESGEATLEEIGEILKLTRERIRQIEGTGKTKGGAIKKMRHWTRARKLKEFYVE